MGRPAKGFVSLAVVVDAFSRKVVGWALDDHLETLRHSSRRAGPTSLAGLNDRMMWPHRGNRRVNPIFEPPTIAGRAKG